MVIVLITGVVVLGLAYDVRVSHWLLYDVGIAHAVRLPEEVLLFRSDNDQLLFDLANVRVNPYDPDGDSKAAEALITSAVLAAIEEVEIRKHGAVRRAAQALDFTSWWLLLRASDEPLGHPQPQRGTRGIVNVAEEIRSMQRLLELGLLETRYMTVTHSVLAEGEAAADRLLAYHMTAFGQAVVAFVADRIEVDAPDNGEVIEGWIRESEE